MECLIYPAAGEPVSLIYPAAGEPVSLIYPAAGEPVSRIYPAAGEPDYLIYCDRLGGQVCIGTQKYANFCHALKKSTP